MAERREAQQKALAEFQQAKRDALMVRQRKREEQIELDRIQKEKEAAEKVKRVAALRSGSVSGGGFQKCGCPMGRPCKCDHGKSSGKVIWECGICKNCVSNFKNLKKSGVKGTARCLQEDQLQMKVGHYKIFFGPNNKYQVWVSKKGGNEGTPTLRALREAKEKRQKSLLSRRIELQEEIERLKKAEGGRDEEVKIVTLKNGSKVVDTAILHGVEQRMSLDIYRSQFNAKMSALVEAEADIAVEFHAVHDFVAQVAVPKIQPYVRGYQRRKYNLERAHEVKAAGEKHAATMMQKPVRGFLARRERRRRQRALEVAIISKTVIHMQRGIRGHLARRRVGLLRYQHDNQERLRATIVAQCAVRAWLSKRRWTDTVQKMRTQKFRHQRGAAVRVLQRYVRGHMQRQRFMAVRMQDGLHHRLRRYCNSYFRNGDLWGLLRAVDADYRNMEKEAKLEQENATIFIREVVDRREKMVSSSD
eukprot:g3836.t1